LMRIKTSIISKVMQIEKCKLQNAKCRGSRLLIQFFPFACRQQAKVF